MNVDRDWLTQQTDILSERVTALLQCSHADLSEHPELLLKAFAELSNALEELRVAQEVLQQRNQELLDVQTALDTERQRYRELFEFAPDGYIITDVSGRIQEVNQAASQLFKMPKAYMLGKPLTVFMPEAERRALWIELDRLPRTGRLQEWSTQLQPRDGAAFDAALTVTTIVNSAGKIVGLRWIMRDISQRLQLEETRLRATLAEATNQALNAEIDQRKQLEQNLRQQAVALNQANTLKDEFLAIVSHELRAPLNAILGWSQMLRSRQMDTERVDRALESIERNAKAQATVVSDLLDISRIIQGKLQLSIRSINLITVIRSAIDSVQLAANAKQIELQTVFDRSEVLVSGDVDRLQQIVWNLLSNAIKFTPAHGRIELRLTQTDSHVQMIIKDSGQGIQPDFLPYVFDRFRQAERATTRHHGGLGLALAIVRQLAEMHGGTVAATSPGEGQGATFTVELPRLEIDRSSIKDSIEAAPDLSNVSILVVDDEADTRELMQALLGEAGAIVQTAASVDEAWEMLQQGQPDVLISDIAMPNRDGYDLIRQVRAFNQTLPAIALTAYARDEDRERLLAAGFQVHLSKPVEEAALLTAVMSQLASA
ncbi:PAS/PAC Sensor Hybrid histidine kinase [Leptolyngbya sp. NIES-3755]|nr:PAS/PAC Sensor Hybrid histidine kinase [Leptolyngbya sp. NIES-3755]